MDFEMIQILFMKLKILFPSEINIVFLLSQYPTGISRRALNYIIDRDKQFYGRFTVFL